MDFLADVIDGPRRQSGVTMRTYHCNACAEAGGFRS